jgi:hypothetical protein
MKNSRTMAFDAAYMILYVGAAGAMFALSIALIAFFAIHGELTSALKIATAFNVAGWMVLPFAPSLYRSATGRPFHWASNEVFGAL